MTITVPQSRLILKTIMATLRNNLVFSDLIDWEVHPDEFNDRNGFTVSEQVGPNYNITQTTGAVADLSGGTQSSAFGAQTFTLNTVFGASMGATDIEHIKTIGDARRATALNNAMSDMAAVIDYHIADVAMKAFPWSTGTPGQDLDNPIESATARQRLADIGLESDMDINQVFRHVDHTNLASFIYNDNAALASEGSRAMRRGFRGMMDGIPVKTTNQLARLTTGTRTNGAVDGAAQNVDYTAVADSGAVNGRYLTQSLVIDGLGANATITAGEIFTIAGVNSWDRNINQSRGFAQQFVVVADATADGTGEATVTIFPAIVVQGGTDVNNAHATVDAAPADNAVVTFVGAASTTYIPRIMFKKEAIVAHSAQLMLPYTGQGYRRSLSEAQNDSEQGGARAPLMPRLWFYSDPQTGRHDCRIDVFVEAQPRDRWRGVKFFGTV